MTSATMSETTPVFQLKGGLYTLTALQLLNNNLSAFEKQLENKILQAPKFFYHAPVVIDLQKFNAKLSLDFALLKKILTQKNLIPVGVKGGSVSLHEAAIAVGFPILNESAKEKSQSHETNEENLSSSKTNSKLIIDMTHATTSPTNEHTPSMPEHIKGSATRVVTEPVRSGQQIYVRGGDLIVLAPVSHGSELLADGHIHVYGPLRGRALAGITGDTHARIFCQSLEAELISIAGQYKISEDIDPTVWKLAVDISLVQNRLHIKSF